MANGDGKKYVFSGRSADTDTLVASGKAYLAAVNRGLRRDKPAQKLKVEAV
jgi:hypothetical protein